MELAWICEESGRQFQRVPQQLVEEAGECQLARVLQWWWFRLASGAGGGCCSVVAGCVTTHACVCGGWGGGGHAAQPALLLTALPDGVCPWNSLLPLLPAETEAKAALEAEDMDD